MTSFAAVNVAWDGKSVFYFILYRKLLRDFVFVSRYITGQSLHRGDIIASQCCQLTHCLRAQQTGISCMGNTSLVFVAGVVEPRVRVLGAGGSAELSVRSASSGLAVLARVDG